MCVCAVAACARAGVCVFERVFECVRACVWWVCVCVCVFERLRVRVRVCVCAVGVDVHTCVCVCVVGVGWRVWELVMYKEKGLCKKKDSGMAAFVSAAQKKC